MWLGGSGAVNSYSITSNLALTGSSQAGAFTPDSGSANFNMMGAAIGPPGGTMNGTAMGSLNGSGEVSTFNLAFGGPTNNFTINTNAEWQPAGHPHPPNTNGTIYTDSGNYPMTVNGTLAQTDPPSAGTAGTGNAWANSPFLSPRFTGLTGTSLGSYIQRAAQFTQPGTSGNPALAAKLRAFRRFRRLQRLEALRRATGATTGGRTPGNPAGPILTFQRH